MNFDTNGTPYVMANSVTENYMKSLWNTVMFFKKKWYVNAIDQ